MDVILDSPSEENDQTVSDATGGEAKEEAKDSERRVVSRRPAKRTRTGAKKPARTTRSRSASDDEQKEKPGADAPEDAGEPTGKTADVPEKRVISRRPAKRSRASAKPATRSTRTRSGDEQQNQAGNGAEKAADPSTTATAAPEPANAGEPATEPVAETTEAAKASSPDTSAGAPPEAATEKAQEAPARGTSQDQRRTRRRRQPRRQNDGGGSTDNRGKADRIPDSVADILSDSWTEEKARRYLSEGFLATLSTRLVSRGKVEEIDEEALRERLKVVRRVLADECMVEDDASDLILLDMVMDALADRLEVYRLTSRGASPEKLVQILELRYNADRRLIEAVTALKNA
ncbi:MAG: hypothetical protein OXU79_04015 [Gemmatimonadota bacterium]|nr:hypothetical protein [Gemmatimonadota bacterium]